MVIEFNTTKNYNQIRKLINVLGQDLVTSRDNNKRKGGLLGLAATSIGLGRVSKWHFDAMIEWAWIMHLISFGTRIPTNLSRNWWHRCWTVYPTQRYAYGILRVNRYTTLLKLPEVRSSRYFHAFSPHWVALSPVKFIWILHKRNQRWIKYVHFLLITT